MKRSENPRDQTDIFALSEGDAWYGRNNDQVLDTSIFHDVDLIVQVLAPFKPEISSILEIGCSSGKKIERLANFFSASSHGVDPSELAVGVGQERLRTVNNTDVKLAVGTADKLPYPSAHFDLVHFGFCLYVVARERLFASLAEADRVLKCGGFLSIFDFDPVGDHKRPYHHKSGLYTYKSRYDDFFTGSGLYHLVSKTSFSHNGTAFSKDGNERIALTILYKESEPYLPIHETKTVKKS